MRTAAATLGLSGPWALQARDAHAGLEIWAEDAGVALDVVDDHGATAAVSVAYRDFVARRVDLLLGPYGSGLVDAAARIVVGAGRLLWNHGGSADHLHRPGVVTVVAPASSYLVGAVGMAARLGLDGVVIGRGSGRFAAAVAEGAAARARAIGLPTAVTPLHRIDSGPDVAAMLAGRFEEEIAALPRVADAALVAAVAAGIPAFAQRVGEGAEGVIGPVQWVPRDEPAAIGPSGSEFAARFLRRTGRHPSYVAAQSAAAGWLALAAPPDPHRWVTTSLLGGFQLDSSWRQVGHRVATIRWERGGQVPVPEEELNPALPPR